MLNDANDDGKEKIYTDFNFDLEAESESPSSEDPPVKQGPWGVYAVKPLRQNQWESAVKNEIDKMVEQRVEEYWPYMTHVPEVAKVDTNEDSRPRLYCPVAKKWMLVDTCAQVSVWPKTDYEDATIDRNLALQAVNGTRIPTFGTRIRQIKLGRKAYSQVFILADITCPIVGWNFIKPNRISLMWDDHEQLNMVDRKADISVPLRVEPVPPGTLLKLAPVMLDNNGPQMSSVPVIAEVKIAGQVFDTSVGAPCDTDSLPSNLGAGFKTFQQYSQAKNQQQTAKMKPQTIPPQYKQLVDKYPKLLNTDFHSDVPKHGVVHHIDTGDSKPCTAKVRPLMPGSPKAVQGQKDWLHLESMGIVERVPPHKCNVWTSAIHLVPKPDGTLRCCGDFRALNDKTLLDGYPLPNLQSFTHQMRGATIFSKVDLTKAFHQIPLDPESQAKTTMVTPWGTFMFKKLAMGLRNSAQSFQRLVDHVLTGLPKVFAYMDDILVHSETEEEHISILGQLFHRLNEAGLAINLGKCVFGTDELEYLGYHVDKNGIRPLVRKLQAIAEYPEPGKAKHLLGFLGALNYYRRALSGIRKEDGKMKRPAEILQPLFEAATRKDTTKQFLQRWNEDKLVESFNEAKAMLMQACQLEHPDPNAPIAITTDASKNAMGAVLEQFREGIWRPLGFWSKHFKSNQRNWTTFRRELFAVQQGLRHFNQETNGRHVIIFTDHKSLLGAFKSPTSQAHDPIAMTHIQEVSQFTNDIRYVAGKSNCMADWLSRPNNVPLGESYRTSHSDGIEAAAGEQIAALQQVALEIVDHRALARDQKTCSDVIRHLNGKCPKSIKLKQIEFSPGVTVLCDVSDGKKARPLVPITWRQLIIGMFHQLKHPGQAGTLKKVSDRYYWPDMGKDVSEMVRQCPDCNAVKVTPAIRPPQNHIPVTEHRFKDLQVDVVGPLPPSRGKKYLLTILDRTTRWIEAIPMPEATAENCCDAFIDGWIQRFGLPTVATSDNGNTFVSNLWKGVQKSLGVQVSYTPPYHSSSLGGVERQHKDIKDGLKTALHAMGDSHGEAWVQRLPWVMLARRTAYQPALDCSSADMVFGSNPTIPGDLIGEPGPPLEPGQVQELLKAVQINASKPPIQTSHHRIPTVNYPDVSKFTHVYLKKGKTTPLGPKYEGPFKIIERIGQSCIKIHVGTSANGTPRVETHHWENCKPVPFTEGQTEGQKATRGRKPLDPKAVPFKPKPPPPFKTGGTKPPPPFPAPISNNVHSEERKEARTTVARTAKDNSVQNSDVSEQGGGPQIDKPVTRTRTRTIKPPSRYQDYVAAVKAGIAAYAAKPTSRYQDYVAAVNAGRVAYAA